jgi:ketosteroid isomerase-like protein
VIHKQTVLGFGVVVFLLASSAANGNNLAALRASFAADMRAFNSNNPDTFVASAHDEIVLFGILSPFPMDGKDEFRQVMQRYLADHEGVTLMAVHPEFHISGTTGIAWGYYSLTHKLKNGPLEYAHGRYTFTYTQADGKWVLIAMHFSPLQSTYFMTF